MVLCFYSHIDSKMKEEKKGNNVYTKLKMSGVVRGKVLPSILLAMQINTWFKTAFAGFYDETD